MAEPDCSKTLHDLYHFLDGELTDEKRATVRQHLEACPPCFEAYDFEAELLQVIKAKCQDRVPDELRARIADAIAQEQLEQS